MINYQDTLVTINSGQPNEKSRSYQQIVRKDLTVDDLLNKLQDEKEAKQVISDWFYGFDLRRKAEVRQLLVAEFNGPEKATEKLVKDLMKQREALGKPITEEKARQIVQLMSEQ